MVYYGGTHPSIPAAGSGLPQKGLAHGSAESGMRLYQKFNPHAARGFRTPVETACAERNQ